MTPDRQAKAGRKPIVEGVRDRRTMTDGARTVEIYMPAPPNAPAPTAVNPLTVKLAENITRLGLGVDQFLPLRGRMVPLADMNKAIGR